MQDTRDTHLDDLDRSSDFLAQEIGGLLNGDNCCIYVQERLL